MRIAAGCVAGLALLLGCGPAVELGPEQESVTSVGEVVDATGVDLSSSSGDEPAPPTPACSEATPSCESCESWRVEYQGEAELDDGFSGLVIAPNGDVVVFGMENRERVFTSNEGQGLVVRYSPDGQRIWARAFLDPDAQVTVNAAAFDASGVLVVAAGALRADESPPTFESRVVRLNDEGDLFGSETLIPGAVAGLVPTGPNVLVHSYDPSDQLSTFALDRLEPDGSLTPVLDNGSLPGSEIGVTSVAPGPDGGLYLGGFRDYDTPWIARMVEGQVV